MKSIVYVGMDVHKNSFNLCAIDKDSGKTVAETKCEASAKMVEKFVENIRARYDNDVMVETGYEAGCLGYSLYKSLTALGIVSIILAPSTMQKSAKNKVVKNDRMDALNIARNLLNGTYKSVYVPDEEDEGIKEYIRMIADTRSARTKIKQRINALVLRHGMSYPGKSKWTIAHLKWLRELEMQEAVRETLNEYLAQYDDLTCRIERYAERLDEFYHLDRYLEKVSELRCIPGIDTTAAMTIHVEISDFTRFPSANAFTSYVGLTTGEQSSGDKTNHTGITKQGNMTIRKTLIESTHALVKTNPYRKSKRIKARQSGQDASIITYADKAADRLVRKFRKLINRGVPRNKAIVAVARELACFVWGMETGNIY